MSQQIFKKSLIATLVASALLAGCGGGDGTVSEVVTDETVTVLEPGNPVPISQLAAELEAEPVFKIGAEDVTPPGTATPSDENYAVVRPAAVGPVIYTPAQIRQAYNMPPLPKSFDGLSAEERAKFGAGQTIYVIGAFNSPAMADDLNTFSQTFGLPTCTSRVLPAGTVTLPAHPVTAGCELNVAYAYFKSVTNTKPAFNEVWAREMALDTQWAHAIAPLARIVVIQSPSAFLNALYDSVTIANRMGPGVVSMSFLGSEYNPTSSSTPPDWVNPWDRGVAGVEGTGFRIPGMTYFGAAGDRGGKDINVWPASSPSVIGVGGTTLQFDGVTRSETVWGASGGSWSRYASAPSYQLNLPNTFYNGTTPVLTFSTSETPNQRPLSTSDVSFNADPATGQYTHITELGSEIQTIVTKRYYADTNTGRITTTKTKYTKYNGATINGVRLSSTVVNVSNPDFRVNSQTITYETFPEVKKWYSMGGTSIGAPQWAGITANINAERALRGLAPVGNFQERLYNNYRVALTDVTAGTNGTSCTWCVAGNGFDTPTGWGSPNVDALTNVMVND